MPGRTGVQRYGLLVLVDGPLDVAGRAAIVEELAVKEALVRIHVCGQSARRLAEPCERDLHRRRHRGGNLVLDGEDVVDGAVIGLRPDMGVGGNVDELCRDPEPVACLADAAFQHVGDIQPLADLGHVERLVLERKRGSTGDDDQVLGLRQAIEYFLRDAISKIALVLLGAHVEEWQYRDRARLRVRGIVGRGRSEIA